MLSLSLALHVLRYVWTSAVMSSATHEQQTLLSGGNANHSYTQGHDVEERQIHHVTVKRAWTPKRIIWYAFWTILAALGLGLFIKGWIEADDVDVCSALSYKRAHIVNMLL